MHRYDLVRLVRNKDGVKSVTLLYFDTCNDLQTLTFTPDETINFDDIVEAIIKVSEKEVEIAEEQSKQYRYQEFLKLQKEFGQS